MADSATPTYDKLKPKQQAFVDHYLATGNATDAARLAGYSGSDNTLGQTGDENLKKPKIQTALRERGSKSLQTRIATADEVLQGIAAIAFNSPDEKNRLAALNSLKKRFRVDNDPEFEQLTKDRIREEIALLRLQREALEGKDTDISNEQDMEGNPNPERGPGTGPCGLYHAALDPKMYPAGKFVTEPPDPNQPCPICGTGPWNPA